VHRIGHGRQLRPQAGEQTFTQWGRLPLRLSDEDGAPPLQTEDVDLAEQGRRPSAASLQRWNKSAPACNT
jgi:hypothetical protein